MGHLGVTEVVLVLGLLGLIFAERIVRVVAKRVARTPSSSLPAEEAPREEPTSAAGDASARTES